MSKSDSDPEKDAQLKELFSQAMSLLDQAVRFAFLHCHHQPSPDNEEQLKQRISLLLLENDFRRLRTYDHRAKLKTWLQVMVNREASRFLQRESRRVSLDDASAERFIQPPQEFLLLIKEQRHLLEKVLSKLTPRQRTFFELWRQEWKAEEIAREMGIKVASVYRQKNTLVKKIRELIEREQE